MVISIQVYKYKYPPSIGTVIDKVGKNRDHMCVKLMQNDWEYDDDSRHTSKDLYAFGVFCT